MASLPPADFISVLKQLNAATGYLGLGMPLDAWNELEEIDADKRTLPEVMKVRVDVCMALERWEMMLELCQYLQEAEPNEVGHALQLAYATRRHKNVEAAAVVLEAALRKYYDDALVRYNLSCYYCVMGRIEESLKMLASAFKKDGGLRDLAETDEDLAALR
jgi:tetratricopeptide (TPR) repeat protein